MLALVLRPNADVKMLRQMLVEKGLWVRLFQGSTQHMFLIEPMSAEITPEVLAHLPFVAEVVQTDSEHPLVDHQTSPVLVSGISIGFGERACFIAGPCSIESEQQIDEIARVLSSSGVHFLRGGAFKPRTSPYAFQGHGEKALVWLKRAAESYNLRTVTEVMDSSEVDMVAAYADMIQIGARNMYNYSLLKQVGRVAKPVLLKRAFSASIEEWMNAGEYCLLHGAQGVVFCERGIRSFDTTTRNVLDLGAVAFLAHVKKLPVMVDPSHAVGRRDLVPALVKASIAAGASGVMVETHGNPGQALSDGPQALSLDDCARLMTEIQ